ncbi:MAG: zinc-dependent peptidase [Methylovulum sp.]|nr:zinc-dependent peptidase [Methylovulum sp.]
MNIFKRARVRYILHRYAISHAVWLAVIGKLSFLQGMSAVEKARLRELTTLFLYEKHVVGTQGFELDETVCVTIAVQACLPVLGLGFNCLAGWRDVIVYPAAFRVHRDAVDEAGVVHPEEQVLAGEAWSRGPVVVSWADVARDPSGSGSNVVIHEIAHKLDGLNGRTNGFPPLHVGMSVPQWTAALGEAYQQLVNRVGHHHQPCINAYAATSPAEFFAVISEYFFCAPELLHQHFAEVYRQLRLYYRQDPLLRLHQIHATPVETLHCNVLAKTIR